LARRRNLVFSYFHTNSLPRDLRTGITGHGWRWINKTEQALRLTGDTTLLPDLTATLLHLVKSEAVICECRLPIDRLAAVNTCASMILTLAKVKRVVAPGRDGLKSLIGAINEGITSLTRLHLLADNADDYDARITSHLSFRLSSSPPDGDAGAPITPGLHSCSNRACRNLSGCTDFELKTLACGLGGCPLRYCSRECQIVVWRGGHSTCCLSRLGEAAAAASSSTRG
jgi:hypothetical protein